MSELTRERVKPDELVDFTDLWKEAREKLGYDVVKRQSDRSKLRAKLLKALDDAGVKPFTTESVERYKNRRMGWDADDKICVGMLSAGILVFGLLAWIVGIVFISVILWCVVALGGMALLGAFVKLFSKKQWTSILLSSYDRPVPEFAIQTALDMRKHFRPVSKLNFWIVEEAETHDPFLVVGVDGLDEWFYLEVWNEPGFDKKRIV